MYGRRGDRLRSLLGVPRQAAHVSGKLLSRLGEDRMLRGTDSVCDRPPQPQIMAFRVFNISQEFQHRYRYPALTDTIKAKVLGLNAARLFAVDRRRPGARWPPTSWSCTARPRAG